METEANIGKLTATRRQTTGKGFAHRLRAQGLIPAICYGQKSDAIMLTVDPAQLKKALDPGKRRNTVIELTVDDAGKTEQLQVMLKDYQIDPLKQTVLHADFILVDLSQEIEVAVPLVLNGKPEGVKLGGTLHQVFRHLQVTCTPDKIPVAIEGDVSALELNESISISDLVIPEGVSVALPLTQTCAAVMAPRAVEEEEEEVEEGAEGEEGEAKEGEEGEAKEGEEGKAKEGKAKEGKG